MLRRRQLQLSLLLLCYSWLACSPSAARGIEKSRHTGLHKRIRRLERPTNSISDFQARHRALQRHFAVHGHQKLLQKQLDRGIVITAGGRRLLTNAYIVIRVIRESLNSSLPIELFYDGQGEADSKIFAALKNITGVSLRDASKLPRPAHLAPWPEELHGYAKKVYSLYSSSFTEVLIIDSDSQPLIKPDQLFELPKYRQHGALFWPDYWTANSALEAPKRAIYEILGLSEPWAASDDWSCVESGQVVFNRQRHMDVLEWVLWLNIWDGVVYQFMLGDKDTFEIGFMLSEKHDSFYRFSTPPRSALTAETPLGELHHAGMVQCIEGRPAFLHRTSGGKFDPSKPLDRHFWPVYFTEPMSVMAAKQLVWNTQLALSGLPAHLAKLGRLSCTDLHPLTPPVLREAVAARAIRQDLMPLANLYTGCRLHYRRPEVFVDRIALLPMALYGEDVIRSVNNSFKVFEELVKHLN